MVLCELELEYEVVTQAGKRAAVVGQNAVTASAIVTSDLCYIKTRSQENVDDLVVLVLWQPNTLKVE